MSTFRDTRRTLLNPFERPDVEAQAAIAAAFIACAYSEETATAFAVGRKAKASLIRLVNGLKPDDAANRIRSALAHMWQGGALDVPTNILGACTLRGDRLHPDTRAYLGLPPLRAGEYTEPNFRNEKELA